MNPMNVALARTARLAREAATPVYSTSTPTPVREHLQMVEVESMLGRFWSKPMPESKVSEYMNIMLSGDTAEYYEYAISDIDCSVKCWCAKEGA